MKIFFTILIIIVSFSFTSIAGIKKITVSCHGDGDYKTITEAIKSLPDFNYERIIIFIKNGIYNERIRIEQNYISLKGESRDSTILRYSLLRSEWDKNPDTIGPGVVNVFADDIIIQDLTIENSQPEIGPHAFTVYGKGTRTIITNCSLLSYGADTVSLWDNVTGMYYHSDCFFKGAVDFVCPRGWCYIKNSRFYEVKATASVWHAGGDNIDQKFVLYNCDFDGVKGFKLGRHHYEAQFYFVDCHFSKNLADEQIYRVTYKDSTRNRPFNWGKRYYFYNCQKDSIKYSWLENNISEEMKNKITPEWTFDQKWNPESEKEPKILKYEIVKNELLIFFNETVTVSSETKLSDKDGNIFTYISGTGSNTIRFKGNNSVLEQNKIRYSVTSGYICGNGASVNQRYLAGINIVNQRN